MVDEATVICDLSGSMVECGKRFIVNTVLRTIDQYYRMLNPNASIKLLSWKDGLEELDWSSGEKLPEKLMDCSGTANVDVLINEFGDYLDAPLIVLSDGYWDDSQKKFSEWAKSVQDDYLRVILIGADANAKLKFSYAYPAEKLLAALENLGD